MVSILEAGLPDNEDTAKKANPATIKINPLKVNFPMPRNLSNISMFINDLSFFSK